MKNKVSKKDKNILLNLERQIAENMAHGVDKNEVSWGYQYGILISINDAKELQKAFKEVKGIE